MLDFLQAHGEWIIGVTVGLIGFGKLWQQGNDNKIRIVRLEEKDNMTEGQCALKQDACHLLQKSYHTGLEKDIEVLRADIRAVISSNETQHETIMAREDTRHDEIIKHLMTLTGKKK